MIRLKSRIWDTRNRPGLAPEVDDPKYKLDAIVARPSVGVAFSGGGTRSATATLGQLRALRELRLLHKVRYVSCVSGGSWTCVPFTYLNSVSDADFLGEALMPDQVTKAALRNLGAKRSHMRTIANSKLLGSAIKRLPGILFLDDEAYADIIGRVFLHPYGLNDERMLFTWGKKTRDAIIAANKGVDPQNPLDPKRFYTVQRSRPFLIASGTVLRGDNPRPRDRRIYFEMTPLYVGAPALHRKAGEFGLDIGGGFVETFAFDSKKAVRSGPRAVISVMKRRKNRFTLADVIATSGAAPAEKVPIKGFPEFNYWLPNDPGPAVEYDFGDGGILENTGVMALLRRRVKRVILFVNSNKPFSVRANEVRLSSQVTALFGKGTAGKVNQVFPTADLKRLGEAFGRLSPTKPLVYEDEYQVRDNAQFGVRKGWRVKVLWVYNNWVEDWVAALPRRTQETVRRHRKKRKGMFRRFPHYKTFEENPPEVIDLRREQVNLLAHLSYWVVKSQSAQFRSFMK